MCVFFLCSGLQTSCAVGLYFEVFIIINFDLYFIRKDPFSWLLSVNVFLKRPFFLKRVIFLNFLFLFFTKLCLVSWYKSIIRIHSVIIPNDKHENW